MHDRAVAIAGNPAACDADASERLPRHTRTSSGGDMPYGSPPQPPQGTFLRPSNPAAALADAPPRSVPQPHTATSAASPPQRRKLGAWVPEIPPLRTASVPAASLRAAAEEAEAADAQSQPAGLQARHCTTKEHVRPGGGWQLELPRATLLCYTSQPTTAALC